MKHINTIDWLWNCLSAYIIPRLDEEELKTCNLFLEKAKEVQFLEFVALINHTSEYAIENPNSEIMISDLVQEFIDKNK
jgi:hypothetical protein